MSHDDRSDLACSFCNRTRPGVQRLGSPEFPICAECAACSFCGKTHREYRKLLVGRTSLICDECVALFADIIEEELVGESLLRVGKDLSTASDRDRLATTHAVRARRFAESCEEAAALPRPIAERARALADEIEALVRAQAGG
jgi:hypothetical protein